LNYRIGKFKKSRPLNASHASKLDATLQIDRGPFLDFLNKYFLCVINLTRDTSPYSFAKCPLFCFVCISRLLLSGGRHTFQPSTTRGKSKCCKSTAAPSSQGFTPSKVKGQSLVYFFSHLLLFLHIPHHRPRKAQSSRLNRSSPQFWIEKRMPTLGKRLSTFVHNLTLKRRLQEMSSSTALLPKDRKKDDHVRSPS
jgi:hypothetical protein